MKDGIEQYGMGLLYIIAAVMSLGFVRNLMIDGGTLYEIARLYMGSICS